jgi:predicted amidohydrolase YtcJ
MTTFLLYNGPIYTLNPQQPRVQALAVRDGRVLAAGSEGKVSAAAGGRAEGINLQGRAVVPGLCDAHVHFTWQGLAIQNVQLDGAASIEEALDRIVARADSLNADSWLRGRGWDHSLWGGRWPTAAMLDAACGDRPAVFTRKDGHSSWLSTAALELAGIDADTPDPPGGQVQRDRDGRATGILLETAQELVRGALPDYSARERQQGLRDAMAEALSYGITSVQIPPGLGASDGRDTLADLQQLRERGELRLRCLAHIARGDLEAALALGVRSGIGDAWLRIGGLKLFADGSLGSETAEMLYNYEGRRHTGLPTLSVEELNDEVGRAIAGGISVIVHAIGDAANRKVLDAIEAALNDEQPTTTDQQLPDAAAGDQLSMPGSQRTIPNRIEHAQVLHQRDIPRFARLGVIASMQPVHATSDMLAADELWGPRCANAYAWRALKQAGATLAFGSDAPVESLNPWWGVHAAVTRRRRDGSPPNGWYPEQCISVQEALEAYCLAPALCSGEAAEKGALKPGMLADLAVLSANPFTCPADELHAITAELTMVEGAVVWERGR